MYRVHSIDQKSGVLCLAVNMPPALLLPLHPSAGHRCSFPDSPRDGPHKVRVEEWEAGRTSTHERFCCGCHETTEATACKAFGAECTNCRCLKHRFGRGLDAYLQCYCKMWSLQQLKGKLSTSPINCDMVVVSKKPLLLALLFCLLFGSS